MRRPQLLAVLLCTTTLATSAVAQFQPPPQQPPRIWFGFSDGFGPSGGGISGSTGLSQLFRATGTVAITQNVGVELTALRIQESFPATKLLSDPTLNSPRADGILASFAQLSAEGRGRRYPSVASIGGGVARRPTNDPTKTRLTGAFQLGVESSVWRPPVSWFDTSMGLRVVLMPSTSHRMLYMLGLTLGIRAG